MWCKTSTAGALAAAAMLAAAAAAPARAAGPAFDPLPMNLPPVGARAAAGAVPDTWILGIGPSSRAQAIAVEHGADRISDGAVVLSSGRAREAAAALRAAGMLRYAEPDVPRRRASVIDGQVGTWARAVVVEPSLLAPPPGSVAIGVIDDQVDVAHGDLAGHTTLIGGGSMTGAHGTAVASAASATAGNGGVTGVFPGVTIMSYGVSDLSCSDVVRGIDALVARQVQVINISLGSPVPCVAESVAIAQAIGEGIVVTAAAGNEFEDGNAVQFPAGYPHVLSVAAVGPDLAPSGFSNVNAAIDLSAPGEDVPVAVPLVYDVEDGVQDGVTLMSGTSFSAPIVAGAAAWLSAVRPGQNGQQIAELLRRGAQDVGRAGWDPQSGWGLVNVGASLVQADPPVDPLEPNDDIPFVNGTYFQGGDPPIYRGVSRRLSGSVDEVEDPYDVYRIRVPGRSALRASVIPKVGDPDLYAYHDGARSVSRRRAIVDQSLRRRGADRVFLVNHSRRDVLGYLVVAAGGGQTYDARYSLRVTRTPYRTRTDSGPVVARSNG
jgi:Subtilase family